MEELRVRKPPLPWWLGGLLLGLTQVLAVAVDKPLGVSTQFVVVDALAVRQIDANYAAGHSLIGDKADPKTGKVTPNKTYGALGKGFWLDVGLVAGALLAAVIAGLWRLRAGTVWWRANHSSTALRLLVGLAGGFLILMGARLAHGCTSGQFASGWAQLSLSALPFTVTLFAFAMLTALLFYRKTPKIE
jgi:hypothetical protein